MLASLLSKVDYYSSEKGSLIKLLFQWPILWLSQVYFSKQRLYKKRFLSGDLNLWPHNVRGVYTNTLCHTQPVTRSSFPSFTTIVTYIFHIILNFLIIFYKTQEISHIYILSVYCVWLYRKNSTWCTYKSCQRLKYK